MQLLNGGLHLDREREGVSLIDGFPANQLILPSPLLESPELSTGGCSEMMRNVHSLTWRRLLNAEHRLLLFYV